MQGSNIVAEAASSIYLEFNAIDAAKGAGVKRSLNIIQRLLSWLRNG
jgi:hypothetical protein